MPRYPDVFVRVSDSKPIGEIIERAERAMNSYMVAVSVRRNWK